MRADTPRSCVQNGSLAGRNPPKIVGLSRCPSATIEGVSTQFDIEQPVARAGGWRVLAPFRFREYRLLIAAVSLSIFADGMFGVVLALQVIELDNDPVSLSIVTTCFGAALVAFCLVGRPAADRINQRRIIIAVETVNVARLFGDWRC